MICLKKSITITINIRRNNKMALIKCSECGKEISDKAKACPNCGYPLSIDDSNSAQEVYTIKTNTQDVVNLNKKARKQLTLGKKILISLVSVVVLLVLVCSVWVMYFAEKATDSFDNISPYLDYVGVESDGYISDVITEELYKNIEDVEFWGKNGIVEYEIHDGFIVSCTWSSFDFVSEKEFRKFAKELYLYFDQEADIKLDKNYDGSSYEYCYVDNYYNLDVRVGHDLFNYDPEGQIDIRWSCSKDQLKKDTDYVAEDEREEARDYDEFKSVITDCLPLIPNCELYLGNEDTGSNDSYTIKVENEIIGILGVHMDNYDVIALIDDGKDLEGKYQEQISIAMIMSCDSSINYESAFEIYQQSGNEDSVKIKTGIYAFKGIVNGMKAFGIDIGWL